MSSLNVSVLWIIFQLWFFVNLGLSWLSWCSEAKGWKKIKQWPFLCYRRVIPVSASQGWSREKSTRVYLYNRRYWAEQASCLFIYLFFFRAVRSAKRETRALSQGNRVRGVMHARESCATSCSYCASRSTMLQESWIARTVHFIFLFPGPASPPKTVS